MLHEKKKIRDQEKTTNQEGEEQKKKEKKQPIICYECKKSDHFRSECPQLKKGQKKFKKKKTMMAIWSDSDDSITDEESHEEANLYLMVYKNEVTPKTQNKFTYDELLEAFHELLNDLKELETKIKN